MANPLQSPTLLAAGQTLGGCRVGRLLGRGGMAEVYLAHHVALEKSVAVKVLPPEKIDSRSVDRFFKEARIAAQVEHPNVVTIHDVGQQGEHHFIVMQYVEGKNLGELLQAQGGPLPWRTALSIIRQAAKGLAAVHARGLIHRDIKPTNIMVSNSRRVLLMDFGLVREESRSDLTEAGAIVGTPAYMSPEQCRGETLEKRSDVYALGGTLYTLLTAKLPFQGSAQAVMLQIASGSAPRPVHEINPYVPASVSSLVAHMMAPRPRDRLPDADAVVREVSACLAAAEKAERAETDTHEVSHAATVEPPIEASLAPLLLIEIEDEQPSERKVVLAAIAVAGSLALVLLATFLHWAFGPPKSDQQAMATVPGETSQTPEAVPKAEPAPPADINGGKSERRPAATAKMIWIPPGAVQIGDSPARLRDHLRTIPTLVKKPELFDSAFEALASKRVERLTVPGFWIDRYEVTNVEYAEFVSATGHDAPSHWNGRTPPATVVDQPVTNVTHDDALAYASWAGKLLPTEAQWLRAFRGDRDTFYPWSDVPDSSIANVGESLGFNGLTSVNATPNDRSPFGVCNMVGNVREMVRDVPDELRQHLVDGQGVVIKGADCLTYGDVYGIASYRLMWTGPGPEGGQSAVIGFRCVVEP